MERGGGKLKSFLFSLIWLWCTVSKIRQCVELLHFMNVKPKNNCSNCYFWDHDLIKEHSQQWEEEEKRKEKRGVRVGRRGFQKNLNPYLLIRSLTFEDMQSCLYCDMWLSNALLIDHGYGEGLQWNSSLWFTIARNSVCACTVSYWRGGEALGRGEGFNLKKFLKPAW